MHLGHINGAHGHSAQVVADLAQDLLISMEMLVAAGAFFISFPIVEFAFVRQLGGMTTSFGFHSTAFIPYSASTKSSESMPYVSKVSNKRNKNMSDKNQLKLAMNHYDVQPDNTPSLKSSRMVVNDMNSDTLYEIRRNDSNNSDNIQECGDNEDEYHNGVKNTIKALNVKDLKTVDESSCHSLFTVDREVLSRLIGFDVSLTSLKAKGKAIYHRISPFFIPVFDLSPTVAGESDEEENDVMSIENRRNVVLNSINDSMLTFDANVGKQTDITTCDESIDSGTPNMLISCPSNTTSPLIRTSSPVRVSNNKAKLIINIPNTTNLNHTRKSPRSKVVPLSFNNINSAHTSFSLNDHPDNNMVVVVCDETERDNSQNQKLSESTSGSIYCQNVDKSAFDCYIREYDDYLKGSNNNIIASPLSNVSIDNSHTIVETNIMESSTSYDGNTQVTKRENMDIDFLVEDKKTNENVITTSQLYRTKSITSNSDISDVLLTPLKILNPPPFLTPRGDKKRKMSPIPIHREDYLSNNEQLTAVGSNTRLRSQSSTLNLSSMDYYTNDILHNSTLKDSNQYVDNMNFKMENSNTNHTKDWILGASGQLNMSETDRIGFIDGASSSMTMTSPVVIENRDDDQFEIEDVTSVLPITFHHQPSSQPFMSSGIGVNNNNNQYYHQQSVLSALWTSTIPEELHDDVDELRIHIVENYVSPPLTMMRKWVKGSLSG